MSRIQSGGEDTLAGYLSASETLIRYFLDFKNKD